MPSMTNEMPGWFQCHHESVGQELDEVKQLLGRIIKMSETTDQALADLTALEHAHSAALSKLQGDVTAALARIQGAGTLTAAQQAEVDALKAAMTADTETVAAIDASTQPAPAP